MPIEFFEIPQGAPSIAQAQFGVGYCTPSDVAAMNKARIIGQGQNPTLTDVDTYILMAAGQLDAILVNKGYDVPVNTASYPETAGLLAWANATGAWQLMEEASPNSPNIDRAQAAFDAAKKMLADAKFVMELPMEQARSEPRGPWLTFRPTGATYDPMLDELHYSSPTNDPRNSYFSRQQQY